MRKLNSSVQANNRASAKTDDLAKNSQSHAESYLTSAQGVRINDDQNSLRAGDRGPSLLEDFLLREKLTHFDHERIPERVVHARGAGAHGYFETYESQSALTKAAFLQTAGQRTPVFVRFSTVAGSRGSTDVARDARGFAVKFYTEAGNYDLVGNNIPVFFIQDAIKFPDLIHAVKPEPHNEMPQAASAHDTFWDFISLMPESMHMVLWVMSDRAIPRSLRMMQGFGVHTFKFVNAQGESSFVKFHWKPLLGVHSLLWTEAQAISGQDPDFHRRDLWEAIESGAFPEWELGVQVVAEKDEHKFEFDLLDPTKLIPEELVPVQRIGKMVLNRNPDNFFAETEQVAFHAGHVVPGIDFSDDPLLQGRLFSYTDTQLIRLGGPNFHEIPINRSVVPIHSNQRDGHMRQGIDVGRVSYSPNTLGGGCPMQAGAKMGGFVSHAQALGGSKVRAKSAKFFDHFSQAAMFFKSQTSWEQDHIVRALQFELGKLEVPAIRERMIGMLAQVDSELSALVAEGLGLPTDIRIERPINRSFGADADPGACESLPVSTQIVASPALSIAHLPGTGIMTRKIAILAADGVDAKQLLAMQAALKAAGASSKIIAPRGGTIKADDGQEFKVDHSLMTTASVLFDALYLPGGASSVQRLTREPDALTFVQDTFKHCKTIAASDAAVVLVRSCLAIQSDSDPGLILLQKATQKATTEGFIAAVAMHRHWAREPLLRVKNL